MSDHTKPMVRSQSHLFFTMQIDGESVVHRTDSVGGGIFLFRGETLINHGGGSRVGYNVAKDRPEF